MSDDNSENKSLLKPFTWVAFANIITKPLWAFLFIYAARSLGSEQFGVYTYANSLAALLSIFFDLGLDYIAVRSITRENKKVNNYFNEVLFLRIFLFILVSIFLLSPIFTFQNPKQYTANLLILVFQFLTIVLTFLKAIASAYQEFNLFAKMLIWEKIIVIIFGFVALMISADLIIFLYSFIIGNVISILLFYSKLKKKYSLKFIMPPLRALLNLLKEAIPFIVLNIFIIIYFRIDVMFLDYYSNNKSIVGIYGSIHRLVEMYLLIPTVMMSAAFPIITKYIDNKDYIIKIVNNIITFQIILSLSVAIFIGFNSYAVNQLLFGYQYEIGAEGLIFIIWTCIPLGLNFILGNLLVSIRKEKLSALSVAAAAILSVLLNLYFTPRYSFVGTSIVALISEIFILFLYTYFTLKYFGKISIISVLVKSLILITITGMVFSLYTHLFSYNFIASISLLIIVIFILFIILKLLKLEQLKSIMKLRF